MGIAIFVHESYLDDFIEVMEDMGYSIASTKSYEMFSGVSILVTVIKYGRPINEDDKEIIEIVRNELRNNML